MPLEANLVLYHCNDEKRCLKFLDSDKYMIISNEDGRWLGQGMYFWDNYGNAKYWEKVKQRKDIDKKYLIVKARVSLENILDLTDIEVCRKINKIWLKYKKTLGIDSEPELGKKLNLLYKTFPGFIDQYKVIKISGRYINTPQNGFIEYERNGTKIEPFLSAKIIYNVKKKEAILERIICEEEAKDEDK